MATGLKANNVAALPIATSWEDLYQIDGGGLTNLTRANFKVLPLSTDGKTPDIAICWYLGTGAITTSELNNLPEGSMIIAPNIATPTIYIKEGASTFNAIT